jgi:hypothetical protein
MGEAPDLTVMLTPSRAYACCRFPGGYR